MKSVEYRSILGRLPIKCPTPEDMAMLCPHLTEKQAVRAFTSGNGYVACPPLRVRHGFQIVTYSAEWVEQITASRVNEGEIDASVTGTKNHPAQLRWSYAGRTRKSYADGKSHGDLFTHYKQMDRAMKFAEDNWGDELILDDWTDVLIIYVQDPTDLVNDRYHHDYPRTKAALGVMLNRPLNDIKNDYSKPESVLFDEAIAELTVDPHIWHELKGGRGQYTDFNCAYCGAGLSLAACTGCHNSFRDDGMRCGWSTPLSPKMVAFLREHGHEFGIDPEVAWTAERERWESYRR